MSRNRINLNREWKFFRGDALGAQEENFDDSAWQPIGLPHTFDLPYFRTPEFYVGPCWYRRTIDCPQNCQDKKFFLEFEGAFQVADVFINGQPVGRHAGGYTGFSIDITRAIRPGNNTVAIRVDNTWNPQLAPRAGEHIFSGGLYRDLTLVIVGPQHFTWHGIEITTPHVSADSATAHLRIELANDTDVRIQRKIVSELFDPDGIHHCDFHEIINLPPHTVHTIEQTLPPLPNPRLWHPDHPNLYTIRTRLYDRDTLLDEVTNTLGFRWFEWTPDRGFFLNGQHLYLRGANAHQDHAGWGIAITQSACHRDAKLLKEAGFNFVRGAHYPHHPAFADACDQLGLIFWSENSFWGKGGFGPEGYWNASAYPVNPQDEEPFAQHCKQTLREMIRINRNHPSIMIWSMTNEAFFTYNLDRARTLMSDLVKLSKELDPTRPAAIGGAQRGHVDHLGDVAGYNGDGARLFLDPNIPNMVSEYGAISKPYDAYDPFFGDLQPEQFPWRAGEAIWCAFDYGSIAGRQGLKGILHHNRLPKRSWYWYRNELRKIPPTTWPAPGISARLQLSADKTTIQGTDAIDDCQIIVTILNSTGQHISDCPEVTLTIQSGPGEFPTGARITFQPETDIPITDGQAAIAFRSYHAGQTLIRATSPGLKDDTLTITTTGDPQFIPGKSLPPFPRPYKPPQPSPAALAAMKNIVDVARDRPSRAATELPDHPPRHANDADPATSWQPLHPAAGAWLQIDLEGFYELSAFKIIFTAPANYRYQVEMSLNAKDWTLAIDRTKTIRADAVRNDVFDPGTTTRYVRLTFTGIPPEAALGVRAFELYGILSVR